MVNVSGWKDLDKEGRRYRDYFKNALNEIDESDFVITDLNSKLRMYQYEELMDFLCVKHCIDVMKIESSINRLKTYYVKMNITKENPGFYHTILQPRSENYMFLSSESESDDFDPSSDSVTEEEKVRNTLLQTKTKTKTKTKSKTEPIAKTVHYNPKQK